MSKITKLITALLLTVFCFTLFTVTAMAVGDENSSAEQPGGNGEVIVPTDAPPVPPPTTPLPVETDPIPTEAPTTSYWEPETEAPTYDYADTPTQAPTYVDNDYDDGYDDDYNSSQNSYDNQQDYNNVQPNTESTAVLYDTNHKIDSQELSNNDWKEISANLANASNNAGDDDGDFSFIQKNSNTGDNGYVILISGIVCILLGMTGVIYIIGSKASRNKKLSGNGNAQHSTSGGGHFRASDDYDDGYKRSKYDTADVKLPKSKKSGGRRFK